MAAFSGPADWWTDDTNKGRYHINTKGIVTDELVFHIDASVTESYIGSGTTWTDLTSSPINLTINNGTFSNEHGGTFTPSSPTALFASGANQAIDSKISFTENFSIEQVFKPTDYQPSAYYGLTNQLFTKGSASTYNYATQLNNDTTVSFIKRTSPENLKAHNFTVPSMQNKVNVLAFVVSSNTTIICYMNGILIGSTSVVGDAITPVNNDPIRISTNFLGNDSVLIGNYYSCKIYNKALSAAEVKQNFNALRGRYDI